MSSTGPSIECGADCRETSPTELLEMPEKSSARLQNMAEWLCPLQLCVASSPVGAEVCPHWFPAMQRVALACSAIHRNDCEKNTPRTRIESKGSQVWRGLSTLMNYALTLVVFSTGSQGYKPAKCRKRGMMDHLSVLSRTASFSGEAVQISSVLTVGFSARKRRHIQRICKWGTFQDLG